MTVIPETRPAH